MFVYLYLPLNAGSAATCVGNATCTLNLELKAILVGTPERVGLGRDIQGGFRYWTRNSLQNIGFAIGLVNKDSRRKLHGLVHKVVGI